MGKAPKFVQIGNYRGCNYDPNYHAKKNFYRGSVNTDRHNGDKLPLSPISDSHTDDGSTVSSNSAVPGALHSPLENFSSPVSRDQDYFRSVRRENSTGEDQSTMGDSTTRYPHPKLHEPDSKQERPSYPYHSFDDAARKRWDRLDRLESERRARNRDQREDWTCGRGLSSQRFDRDSRHKRSDNSSHGTGRDAPMPANQQGTPSAHPNIASSTHPNIASSTHPNITPSTPPNITPNSPVEHSEPIGPSIETIQTASSASIQPPSPAPDAIGVPTSTNATSAQHPLLYQDHVNWVTSAMNALKEPLDELKVKLTTAIEAQDHDLTNNIRRHMFRYQEQISIYQKMLDALHQSAPSQELLQQARAAQAILQGMTPPLSGQKSSMAPESDSTSAVTVTAARPISPTENKEEAVGLGVESFASKHRAVPNYEGPLNGIFAKRKPEPKQHDNERNVRTKSDTPTKESNTVPNKLMDGPVRSTSLPKLESPLPASSSSATPLTDPNSEQPVIRSSPQTEASSSFTAPLDTTSSHANAATTNKATPLTQIAESVQSKTIPTCPNGSGEDFIPRTAVKDSTVEKSTSTATSSSDSSMNRAITTVPSAVLQTPTGSMNGHHAANVISQQLVSVSVSRISSLQTKEATGPTDQSLLDYRSEGKQPLDFKQELVLIREEAREQRARTDQLMALLHSEALQRRQAEQRLLEMASQLQEQSLLAIKKDLEAKRSEALSMMYKAQIEMQEAAVLVSKANAERAEAKAEALKAQAENQKLLAKIRELGDQRQKDGDIGFSSEFKSHGGAGSMACYTHPSYASGIRKNTPERERNGHNPLDDKELPERILFMQRDPPKKSRSMDGVGSS
ncbi:MAG: hypothetical protein J3Q66DRAFT_321751 [Benniella sp.]|nr:MAG: hypothetical protein J3Q66DRAFT_321751 [Benniella sp.]